ncbi:ABC transporter ATP-binding protein [Streptomyces thermolineatus]|uniref:ABC transporter ATP-binding protein n=1 Tax=Streptomyces thermolineatus TaxID=44033 RepID=UPI00384D4D8C
MTAPPDNDVLWARALVKTYRGAPALRGVSLGVREGEVLAVTGPRGAGKTTLLGCLAGRTRPDSGEVWFGDAELHALPSAVRDRLRLDRFAWIGGEAGLVPELTVRENTALPLLLKGVPRRTARTTAQEWLERLEVADCARRRPARLNRPQAQRVALARALAGAPEVLFADEPTAPLHLADRVQLLRTLTAAARTHRITVLLATHDPDVAAHADRVVELVDGFRAPGTDTDTVPAAPAGAAPSSPPAPSSASDAEPAPGAEPVPDAGPVADAEPADPVAAKGSSSC